MKTCPYLLELSSRPGMTFRIDPGQFSHYSEHAAGSFIKILNCTHCGVYSLQAYAAEFVFTGGDEYSHTVREIYKGFTAIELL